MTKKGKIGLYALMFIALTTVIIAVFMPYNSKLNNLDFYVSDENNNYQYEVNENLGFFLNDTLAIENRKLTWYFGNGDSISANKNINYKYKYSGKYLVSLYVDNKEKRKKYIDIVSIDMKKAIDSIPKIYCVDEAYVGEELVFTSSGPGVDTWRWEFGETGTIDANDHQVVYVYSNPGKYEVKLETNTSQYKIRHNINILPRFEKIEQIVTVDSLSLAANDIKKRLQAIANSKISNLTVFHENINHIINGYVCDDVSELVVIINDSKYNDLYSYCQGLHRLDSKKNKTTIINKVELDTTHCIKEIKVTQSTSEL